MMHRQEETCRTSNPRTVPNLPSQRRRKIETAWPETELHQADNTFAQPGFNEFIIDEDNPLAKGTDGKTAGLEPTNMLLTKDRP